MQADRIISRSVVVSRDFIVVVSGVPRSGTSLVMQMLAAGGFPVLVDRVRRPDAHNPRGYFEFEPVKALARNSDWLSQAVGHAVKVVHRLVPDLPEGFQYRLVLVRRELAQVVASQEVMLAGRVPPGPSAERLAEIYECQLAELESWLAGRPDFRVLILDYGRVLADPGGTASALAGFLEFELDTTAMAGVIEPGLRHHRG